MRTTADDRDERARLTFLGHSTVLIQLDGVRLITDPVLRRRVGPLRRHAPRAAFDPATGVDAVLISHLHWDHLDLPSLRLFGKGVRLLVPRGAGSHLARRGFREIEELEPGRSATVGAVEVVATPAEHRGLPRPLNATRNSVGFLVRGNHRVYFAGDTDLFPAMADLAPLDAALVPVWGWGPTLGSQHLDPERAAQALELLRPAIAVPIHWGTLYPLGLGRVRPSTLTDPPHEFARLAGQRTPDVEVRVLAPGSSTSLDRRAPSTSHGDAGATASMLAGRGGSDTGDDARPAGLLVIQLDGLAEPLLRRALGAGLLPTLERWLASGSHRLLGWETSLPSQTSSSQAGILYGGEAGIPGFRWYEKSERRLLVSNHPGDAAEIERRMPSQHGLLRGTGSSLSNLLSGAAERSTLTLSALGGRMFSRRPPDQFIPLLGPLTVSWALVRAIGEVFVELAEASRQRRRRIRPRVGRGGSYPFLRAASTVLLRDLTRYFLRLDLRAGVPVIYTTFVGYDVVAHHSGPARRDALRILRRLDELLAQVERFAARAPRDYRLVVLSDHGQSQGPTFRQLHRETLEAAIGRLSQADAVGAPAARGEAWGYLDALLSEAVNPERPGSRTLRRVLRPRVHEGYVEVGPERRRGRPRATPPIVVCPSGNLANVYFTDLAERASLEWIERQHPGLVAGVVALRGVGFVLGRSERHGPLVLGGEGVRHLDGDDVEGRDPLAPYGDRAADHLRRLEGFAAVGDLVVVGHHDPGSRETIAFEELVGSHGGLGGDQTRAFVLAPRELAVPSSPLVGASAVHQLLTRWRDGLMGP